MKKEPQSLLKKKITDLTLEDFAQIEKPIGTASKPFPMWGPQRIEVGNRTEIQTVLSAIASDQHPMKIYSERPYEEVMAMAYCDMPVPSMLSLFKDALERRGDPLERQKDMLEGKQPLNENFNRTQMVIGDPGHGKSFMGALMGRMRTKGSIEIFDCGGKNMNDLLFEMVLDFGSSEALPKAIEKRLAAGTLEPLSLGLLKSLPGVTTEGGEIKEIDWQAMKTGSADDVQKAFDVLTKVSKVEGLDNAGGNALGMNSQYGALIRAYLENREIVLDEYNKSREGSDNALQTVIQFLIGEIHHTTVENPLKNKDNTSGPGTFTFKREDMGAGFFVTFTGNKTEDGITTRSLNRSVYDRLKPDTLPDPTVMDWQHRICQMMVGIPVSTLYTVFKETADKDPEGFGDWLMYLRKTKAKIEGVPVPELQETLLSNWKNVVNSSEKLANFYDKWAAMSDAVKITANGNSDLVDEVDEEYTKKEGMSFRRIKQHLEESIPIRPRMEPVDAPVVLDMKNFGKAPVLTERLDENPSLNFGSRLIEYIERMVYEKSGAVGKDKLYDKLTKAMSECSLRDITLQEGARSRQKSVEEDLNISSFVDRDMNKQAEMARKVFCNFLRQTDPEIKATDDQIITAKKFLDALKHVADAQTAETMDLFVANRNHETLATGKPLSGAVIKDTAVYALLDKDLDFELKDLVKHDDFMASLALPTVSRKNLNSIWESNLRPLAIDENSEAAPSIPAVGTGVPANNNAPAANSNALLENDEAMFIAENKSNHGIAMTSLQVLFDDVAGERAVTLHIVRNAARDKTLVIGEKVPSKLMAAFSEAGITHIDRNDVNAKAKVEAALNDLTRTLPASIKDRMKEAFKYRNDVDVEHLQDKNPGLADLLVDGEIKMTYPKFVLKKAG